MIMFSSAIENTKKQIHHIIVFFIYQFTCQSNITIVGVSWQAFLVGIEKCFDNVLENIIEGYCSS